MSERCAIAITANAIDTATDAAALFAFSICAKQDPVRAVRADDLRAQIRASHEKAKCSEAGYLRAGCVGAILRYVAHAADWPRAVASGDAAKLAAWGARHKGVAEWVSVSSIWKPAKISRNSGRPLTPVTERATADTAPHRTDSPK